MSALPKISALVSKRKVLGYPDAVRHHIGGAGAGGKISGAGTAGGIKPKMLYARGAVVVSRPDGIGTLRPGPGARMAIRIGRASRHDGFTDHAGVPARLGCRPYRRAPMARGSGFEDDDSGEAKQIPKNLEREAEVHRRSAELIVTLSPDDV